MRIFTEYKPNCFRGFQKLSYGHALDLFLISRLNFNWSFFPQRLFQFYFLPLKKGTSCVFQPSKFLNFRTLNKGQERKKLEMPHNLLCVSHSYLPGACCGRNWHQHPNAVRRLAPQSPSYPPWLCTRRRLQMNFPLAPFPVRIWPEALLRKPQGALSLILISGICTGSQLSGSLWAWMSCLLAQLLNDTDRKPMCVLTPKEVRQKDGDYPKGSG